MDNSWLPSPTNSERYVLANVRIPSVLCALTPEKNGWCEADILIDGGRVEAVSRARSLTGTPEAANAQIIDAGHSILLSGLVDCHTHIDKAHVASYGEFPAGDLAGAIAAMARNKETWTREDLRARVNFSLQSAYAYGIRAMRSHVDFSMDAPDFIWEVLNDAVIEWQGRIDLQLSPLASIVEFANPEFCQAIYAVSQKQGRVGLFLYDQPNLQEKLLPVFEQAAANGWDIDLHVDEGLEENLDGLKAIADVTLATGFQGKVLCGHCVALNVYDKARRKNVIDRVVEADLHIVALPASNLYLQARDNDNAPQLRGMAPVANLVDAGVTVSLGADNVGDGFCAFGDFDPLAVLNLGAQIGHLHEPIRDWSALITCNPANTMGLEWDGKIIPGAPADLVLCAARNSTEMNRNNAPRRIVIRDGNWIDTSLPDFRKLDK